MIKSIYWEEDWSQGHVVIIDQTLLPLEKKFLTIKNAEDMWEAIRFLRIRGAPALGVAAAFGLFLGVRGDYSNSQDLLNKVKEVSDYLATSRPTAVNLFWALERMKKIALSQENFLPREILEALWKEASSIHREDEEKCLQMAQYGIELLPENARILTHCNAGALATGGIGSALGVCLYAGSQGKKIEVFADETRPLLQGARLTAWELCEANIPVTLICDNTAGFVMQQKKVDLILVGADRIARNGDTANKIGTYSLAVLAKENNIPFYVVAPSTTFDLSLESGSEIPIEERGQEEVVQFGGQRIAPPGVSVYAPAFDITPARYISGIVTEKGILYPDYIESIASLLS